MIGSFDPLIPAKAGTQVFCPASGGAPCSSKKAWVPASAGMSGIL